MCRSINCLRERRLRTQADFLRLWGIEDLVDEGQRRWRERAHLGDLAAVRARSRVAEAAALCDPDGLGSFLVAEWSRHGSPLTTPTGKDAVLRPGAAG